MTIGRAARLGLSTAVLLAVVLGGYFASHSLVRLTVVHGTSMLPTYRDGDLLVSFPQPSYAVNDVITYHPAGLPCELCNVVHRIVRAGNGGWVTQGDNNPNVDGWLPTANQISGKVMLHISMSPLAKVLYQPSLWFTLLFACVSLHFYRSWLEGGDEVEPIPVRIKMNGM